MENTVKEFMEDTELQELAVDETSEVTYAVWAIGYDSESKITDTDMLLGEFTDPDQAVAKAKTVTLADIVHQAAEEDDGSEPSEDIAYISVEVETVVETEDGTMNVGTIFKRELPICDESEEDEYSEVIPVTANDYKLLDDGSIEIPCDILKDFNKNDHAQIWFTDEDNTPILTYRVISKTTANTFICEFVY